MSEDLIFFQLFEPTSSTYTYLLGDSSLGSALLIDPVLEMLERDLQLLNDLNLKLKFVVETHVHADHITGAGHLREITGAQIGLAKSAGVESANFALQDGDLVGEGAYKLKVLATPGHTDTCLSYYGAGMVFTGDALLIRGTGRTDFQQGSAAKLFASVHQKLFTLPESTRVYPAHDYKGVTSSTIALEKAHNPRLGGGRSDLEFIQLMSELKLSPPKRIHEAVSANLKLGVLSVSQTFQPTLVDGIPTIKPEELKLQLAQNIRLVDVRRPEEFTGELGHVAGAELVTLGPDLMRFLNDGNRDEEIVFVCRSGGRSGQATALSRDAGYAKTVNMSGGMLRWNELKFPIQS